MTQPMTLADLLRAKERLFGDLAETTAMIEMLTGLPEGAAIIPGNPVLISSGRSFDNLGRIMAAAGLIEADRDLVPEIDVEAAPLVPANTPWSADEDKSLADLYHSGMINPAIGKVLHRSRSSVAARLRRLGLNAGEPKQRVVAALPSSIFAEVNPRDLLPVIDREAEALAAHPEGPALEGEVAGPSMTTTRSPWSLIEEDVPFIQALDKSGYGVEDIARDMCLRTEDVREVLGRPAIASQPAGGPVRALRDALVASMYDPAVEAPFDAIPADGIPSAKGWTAEEDLILTQCVQSGEPIAEIADQLGKGPTIIKERWAQINADNLKPKQLGPILEKLAARAAKVAA